MLPRIPQASAIIAAGWLSACAISTPFRGPGYDSGDGILLQLNAEQSVVVGLTKAVIGTDRKKNKDFDRNLWNVVARLNAQPGLIGYSVRKQIFGSEMWTMTVWKDEASLIAFVQSQSHTRAIQEGDEALTDSSFVRVRVDAESIPLEWDQVIAWIDEHGRPFPRKPGDLVDLRESRRASAATALPQR